MERVLTPSRVVVCSVVALAVVALAMAGGRREFAGRYQASGATASGDDVSLTFTTDVCNHGPTDVVGATIRLDGWTPEESYATVAPVTLTAESCTRLSQAIAIPAGEWSAWENGSMPRMTIEYERGDGRTFSSRVELIRDALVEEVQP